MTAPLVTLVVITLDGLAHLQAFLPTVAAQDYAAIEVVVVDNGSTDGSAAWLQAHHPSVRVLRNAENAGFARANNQGAEAARGRYLVLVNNDMQLAPQFVSELVAAKERGGPGLACVGARILDWEGQHVDFVAAGMSFEGKGFQLHHGVPADGLLGRGEEKPLLFACGGAMLVDRAVYLEAGGLDEAFFAYYEDVDFGWRLWVLGYEVGLAPKAVAHHRHNGTSSRFQAHRKEVLLERNALMAMLKNYDDRSLAALLPAALLLAFKRLAARSGLDRADWAFARLAAPAPVPAEAFAGRAWRALRAHGPKRCVKKALARLGEALVRRFGGALPAAGVTIAPEAYASAVAVEDLLDGLDAVMAKRREIQALRRRPDGEIFKLFALPFQAVEGRAHYPETEAALVKTLGLDAFFAARQAETERVPR